jgi:hypothetical protein
MYEKLPLMLYADDTIMFVESPEKLKKMLWTVSRNTVIFGN